MSVFNKIESHLKDVFDHIELKKNYDKISDFLSLEKELIERKEGEVTSDLSKKIESLIQQIEKNPMTSTVMGVYQALFFGFLRKISDTIGKSSQNDIEKVRRVELDRLDKK
ncbi:MAG: hypothetical protein QRY74_05815 [Chlamydia sp.]